MYMYIHIYIYIYICIERDRRVLSWVKRSVPDFPQFCKYSHYPIIQFVFYNNRCFNLLSLLIFIVKVQGLQTR